MVPEEEIPPGSIIAGFDCKVPVNDETLRRQVDANMALGLPEVITRRTLTVIANGPSARLPDLRKITGPTLALNGALALFTEEGLAPTYWAACDPQELVAGFVPVNPPNHTTYLIASNCHPTVLENLRGRNIRIWHVGSAYTGGFHYPEAVSVTISACWLMRDLGFTDFEFWGWDGCFMDGKTHAAIRPEFVHAGVVHINFGGKIENGEVIGGRTFSSTRSWAAEAKAAEQFFQLAEYFDIGVKINGDGMFECSRKLLMSEA